MRKIWTSGATRHTRLLPKQNSECATETQATSEALEGSLDENSGFQECVKPCSQEAEEQNERLNEFILQKKNLEA